MHKVWIFALLLFSSVVQGADLRLVDEATHQRMMGFLPHTNDPWFEGLKKQNITFYDKSVMPPAYQFNGTLHSPSYNIAANPDPFGNANREFPWGSPGGVDETTNSKNFKFVVFPKGKKITYGFNGTYDWTYPVGTVFGEVLTVTDPEGKDYTFEVRVRRLEETGWEVDAYRPFTSPQELAAAAQIIDHKGSEEFVAALNSPKLEKLKVEDDSHPVRTFNRTAIVEELNPLPTGVVRLLLSLPFRSAHGTVWRKKDGAEGYAPTVRSGFHIVPRDYKGAYIPVTLKGCMMCHDQVGKEARSFHQDREWYGNIRGSQTHRIFSFHIFDPDSISYNGSQQTVYLNQKLIDAGVLDRNRK